MIPKCKRCGKGVHYRTVKYCDDCKIIVKMERNNKKYEDIENCPVCKICGIKKKSLIGHIVQIHNMSTYEYYSKFNCSVIDVVCEDTRLKLSEGVKGEKNVWFNHGGKLSPFSKNFVNYENLTEKQKEKTIKKIMKDIVDTKNKNGTNPLTIEYFLSKTNGDIKESTRLLYERQATGRLENFIKRYGEEKGLNKWKNRQEKWQNTLNSKSEEEINRIIKARLGTGGRRGFSGVSQELFWPLYNKIRKDFTEIYFAELSQETKEKDINNNDNNEYVHYYIDKKRHIFDFFIKDINKVIEFQGDYWHGEERGNKKRDIERIEEIKSVGIEVLEVFERDFRKNPEDTVNRCLDFIYG